MNECSRLHRVLSAMAKELSLSLRINLTARIARDAQRKS
jgi:hypothetical protein